MRKPTPILHLPWRTRLRAGLVLLAGLAATGTVLRAGSAGLEEGYGDAFVNYRPYVVPRPPAPSPSAPAGVAPTRPPEPAAPKPSAVDVAWLRKNYPLLEERAINDPSDANVAAQMYVQRVIVDKSQRYAEARMRVVQADPLLNENNRVPTASMGARTVANADLQAQEQAVRELAQVGGLLVFVDGACRFCAMQMPVVDMLRKDFGMESLVVSVDGSTPKALKGTSATVVSDNGMFRKLQLTLTPSVVFVPRPKAMATGADPNQYLVVAQGFYALNDLVKQIALAGHNTKLLSAPVMAALGVWDRGVASTDDLAKLSLNPNDPASIKKALQPLLLRQY